MYTYTAHIHSDGAYYKRNCHHNTTITGDDAVNHHQDTDCLVLSLIGVLDKKILINPLLCIHIQLISTQMEHTTKGTAIMTAGGQPKLDLIRPHIKL